MKGVIVRAKDNAFSSSPSGIESTNQVPAIEIVAGIQLLASLHRARHARIVRPTIGFAVGTPRLLAIDVHRSEECHSSFPVENDAIVVVLQLVSIAITAAAHARRVGQLQGGKLRQWHSPSAAAQKGRIVPLTIAV